MGNVVCIESHKLELTNSISDTYPRQPYLFVYLSFCTESVFIYTELILNLHVNDKNKWQYDSMFACKSNISLNTFKYLIIYIIVNQRVSSIA